MFVSLTLFVFWRLKSLSSSSSVCSVLFCLSEEKQLSCLLRSPFFDIFVFPCLCEMSSVASQQTTNSLY